MFKVKKNVEFLPFHQVCQAKISEYGKVWGNVQSLTSPGSPSSHLKHGSCASAALGDSSWSGPSFPGLRNEVFFLIWEMSKFTNPSRRTIDAILAVSSWKRVELEDK